MILVTGSTGFLGTALVKRLAAKGEEVLSVIGNHGTSPVKGVQFIGKDKFRNCLDRNEKIEGHDLLRTKVVVHLGACSDTTCENWGYLYRNNVQYSNSIWDFCTKYGIPLIYASSAATYGDSSAFIESDFSGMPLNKYGWSKHIFDMRAIHYTECGWSSRPPRWHGLKFFNVYGLPEFHKGSQASMPFKFCVEGKMTGKIQIFDVECRRDFVYVGDVCNVIEHLIYKGTDEDTGLLNVGTGEAVGVERVAKIASNWNKAQIETVTMPSHLRNKYQYFSKANVDKLHKLKIKPFANIEEGMALMIEELNHEPNVQ